MARESGRDKHNLGPTTVNDEKHRKRVDQLRKEEADTKASAIVDFLRKSNTLLGGEIGEAPTAKARTQRAADMLGTQVVEATGTGPAQFDNFTDYLKAVQAGTEARQKAAAKKKSSFGRTESLLGGNLNKNILGG